jgi:hypothetical protein
VGKSAFIQKAFNLQSPPSNAISSRKMSIDGNVYVVRLIELSFSELDLDNESRICWPDSVNAQPMPYIDGAFTLYDVMNKESLVQVPETLSKLIIEREHATQMRKQADRPISRSQLRQGQGHFHVCARDANIGNSSRWHLQRVDSLHPRCVQVRLPFYPSSRRPRRCGEASQGPHWRHYRVPNLKGAAGLSKEMRGGSAPGHCLHA